MTPSPLFPGGSPPIRSVAAIRGGAGPAQVVMAAARRLFLSLFLLQSLHAHQIDELTLHLSQSGRTLTAILDADAAYMLPEYRGDADLAPLDLAWLRSLDASERARIQKETEAYLRDCLQFTSGDTPLTPSIAIPDFQADSPGYLTQGFPEQLPIVEVVLTASLPAKDLTITWTEPFGVVLIIDTSTDILPLVSGETTTLQLGDATPAFISPSFPNWIHLGFVHILPRGFDHILFILGIFLLNPKWRPLLGKSLLFTFAHSLTLGLAITGIVSLPDRPVEIGIAASIVWIGIENLRLRAPARSDLILIAGFGLLHGLGFASQLAGLIPPDRPDHLLKSLAGFNLGVEAGQIAILLLAFGLFAWWKEKPFRHLRQTAGTLIALAGLAWLISRAFS